MLRRASSISRGRLRILLIVSGVFIGSCKPNVAPANPETQVDQFRCQKRSAQYLELGGFSAPVHGTKIACSETGAHIKRWLIFKGEGNSKESSHSLSQREFEDFWQKVEDLGWRNFTDCPDNENSQDSVVFRFEVGDEDLTTRTRCVGKVPPFPYDRLLNEFKFLAGKYAG